MSPRIGRISALPTKIVNIHTRSGECRVIDVDPGIFETVGQDHHPLSSNTDAIEGSGAIGPDCSYR